MLLNPLSGYFGYFAGLFYVVLAATLWGLWRRQPAIVWLGVWWASLLVAFNCIPLDWTFTRPLFHHFARTLHPLLLPFAVAAALWLHLALRHHRAGRAAVIGTFTGLAVLGIVVTHRDYRTWSAVARQAAPVVKRLPTGARLVTDPLTAAQLQFLLPSRRGDIVVYADRIPTGNGPVFVLSDPWYLAQVRGMGHPPPPPQMLVPPSSWDRIATFDRRPRTSVRGTLGILLGRRPSPRAEPSAALWRVVS
jgi:hypothetical protein